MDLLLPQTAEDSDMYVFTVQSVLHTWRQNLAGLERHGFVIKNELIWDKMRTGMGDLNNWGGGYETIIFLKKGNRKRSDVRRSSVLSVPSIPSGKLIHPHQKPQALLEMLIKHSTDPGDFIVDPFCGSGSTIIAARTLRRSALGIEMDKMNYDLAMRDFNNEVPSLFEESE